MVRPHLEYANAVTYPHYEKDSKRLENVQRRATKLVPQLRNLDYVSRLKALNLPSLLYRRQRGDMIEVFKYTHNYDINPNPLPLHHGSVTRGHNFKLEKRRPEKSARQKFFTMRAVNEWNALPADIAEATTLNSFKYRLDKHWTHRMFDTPLI